MKFVYLPLFFSLAVFLLFADSRFTSQSGNLIFDSGLDQNKELVLDLAGQIGLGKTPTEKLDISGNAEIIGKLKATAAMITGSIKRGYEVIDSDMTLSDTSTILVDSNNSSVMLQLPSASDYAGTYYHIVNSTAQSPVAINSYPDLMDGVYEISLNSDTTPSELQVLSNGTSWSILSLGGNVTIGSRPFILGIKTDKSGTSGNNQFTLPLNSSYSYNFTIDWGDGTSDIWTSNSDPTHTYPAIGEYNISIQENGPGGFPAVYFNNDGDRKKVLELKQWGGVTWANFNNAFYGCNQMDTTATDGHLARTGDVTNFSSAWEECRVMTNFPYIDTSSATNFSRGWTNCRELTSFPLLDSSKVTTFQTAWSQCLKLASFPLLNSANVTTFQYGWYNTDIVSFPQLDSSKVTSFRNTWQLCDKLTNFPQLNSANVTNFQASWGGAKIVSFPLMDFNNATTLHGAWSGVSTLIDFPNTSFNSLNNGLNTFNGVTLSTNIYNEILLNLSDNNINSNVTFNGGNSKYYLSGAIAKAELESRGWVITDGGLEDGIDPAAFALVIDTDQAGTSSNLQFTLPLDGASDYDFSIIWGDGNIQTITSNSEITHTYSSNGIYTVQIIENVTSGFPVIKFDNSGDRLKVLELANWGDVTWTNLRDAFHGCQNMEITATDGLTAKTGAVSVFSNAWEGCSTMTNFPLIDTSNGTLFSNTWNGCNGLTSFPAIDTSKATTLTHAWINCNGLTNFPFINTGNVSNFTSTWRNNSSLQSFPMIDTSTGTDLGRAWENCSSLTDFPVLNTSNVTNFGSAWVSCNGLTSFPELDTAKSTSFFATWRDCNQLNSFPLLNSANVTAFNQAWQNCSSLVSLPELDVSKGTNFTSTWRGLSSMANFQALSLDSMNTGTSTFLSTTLSTNAYNEILVNLSANNIKSNVTFHGGNSKYYLSGALAKSELESRGWVITDGGIEGGIDPAAFALVIDTDQTGSSSNLQFTLPLNTSYSYDFSIEWGDGNITSSTNNDSLTHTYSSNGIYTIQIVDNVDDGFPTIYFNNGGDKDKVLALANWGENTWSTFYASFRGCLNMDITASDEATANTSDATSLEHAFRDCQSITVFPLIDTSSATSFNNGWYGCTSMTNIALLNSSNVTVFGASWRDCVSLTSFPAMDTSKGTGFKWAWAQCDSLTDFPLIDVSSATILEATWFGCNNLASFPVLDVSMITDLSSAWQSCIGLTSFPLLDTSSVTSFHATWDSCSGITDFPALDMSSGNYFKSTWRVMTSLTELPDLDLSNLDNGEVAFAGVTLSTNSYSELLIDLAATNSNANVIFDGGSSRYNLSAISARESLVNHGWTIADGGYESSANILTEAFALVVDTTQAGTSSSTQFTLPLNSSEMYDFTVDWGDGSANVFTTNTDVTHAYASSGNYTIQIVENTVGGFPAISFNNDSDNLKVLELANWGNVTWSTFYKAFAGCSNMDITATDEATANTGSVTQFTGAWQSCSSLTSFPLIDTSSGTNFSVTWQFCSSLTTFPLIDTSLGTNFFETWLSCSSLNSFPLIDTSSGTSFTGSWRNCSNLSSFPLIDTSSGTDFSYAWYSCSNLSSFPLIDTSLGTNFFQTWYSCGSLSSFPLIDTSSGTIFSNTWRNCSSLTVLPLLSMGNMTNGATAFNGVILSTNSYSDLLVDIEMNNSAANVTFDGGGSKYDISAIGARENLISRGWTITDGGFESSANIVTEAFVLVVDTTQVGTSSSNQFTLPLNSSQIYDFSIDWGDGSTNIFLTNTNITHTYSSGGNYTIQIVENTVGGFSAIYFNGGGDRQKVLELANWGSVTWSTFESAFYSCSNMEITATDHATAKTSSVTNFEGAWRNCSSLSSFPVIDTSSGTNFSLAWRGCSSLSTFPLLDTSAGTNFSDTWNLCLNLTLFPLIDTSSVTDFESTWRNCSSLTSFPAIDTSAGINFSETWFSCSGLNGHDFSQYDFSGMNNGSLLFSGMTLSTTVWSDILIDLASDRDNSSITIDGGSSLHNTAGATAKSVLEGDGWIVNDGGAE